MFSFFSLWCFDHVIGAVRHLTTEPYAFFPSTFLPHHRPRAGSFVREFRRAPCPRAIFFAFVVIAFVVIARSVIACGEDFGFG